MEIDENKLDQWIDDNWDSLNSDFAQETTDQWCCEEQLMDLVESDQFLEFCENKFNEQNEEENGN